MVRISFRSLIHRLHELMLLLFLQAPLFTLMPLMYYYKLPLSAGCNCGQTASPQGKLRAQHVEDNIIPHRVPVLTGVLQPPQVEADLKSVDLPTQRIDSDPRLKPIFIPEFHGFEMFVWSLRTPKVLDNVYTAASHAKKL